jgi:hypothetical protein
MGGKTDLMVALRKMIISSAAVSGRRPERRSIRRAILASGSGNVGPAGPDEKSLGTADFPRTAEQRQDRKLFMLVSVKNAANKLFWLKNHRLFGRIHHVSYL